jgi:amino acid adenylation domain-containing protein
MQTLTVDDGPVPEQISKLRDIDPHSVAMRYGDQQLSYEELDRKADRFAGHLMLLGIVSGGAVAICIERSFDWIIAALGIMRAGAAYIPLDSAWPNSRLRFALNDSGATVLVARVALLDRLQVQVRDIDPCRDAAAIAASPVITRKALQPESLAYVIYTSGSTGVPKGVEITHANLSHLVRWHREAFHVTRQDRASHLAGLGFDAAVWEIWGNLSAGATLCLADDGIRSSPELIQQWLIRERVTIGFVPTVHAAPMMAMEWPTTTALRLLLTGGDALHHTPAVHLPFDVVNNYGPTECTVVATSSVLKPGSHGTPPIGRPIADTSVYLLNEQGQQVPDGTPGEIFIGGGGVGRGYRNLPDLTARCFLPDPFAGTTDARMYRSGDRGVRRPDGEVEFCGRLDRQTKIRGHRVELDEIDSILTQHPGIDFATAVTSISNAGENQLVAYVLPRENAWVPTARELQKHLLRSLPEYMIPAIFVQLHVLPVSPSGKLDLKMLPPPTDANLLERIEAKAPANQIEEKLLAMVRETLKNDTVAVEDNFFLAGGHSLLGMQLVMHLRKALGVDLTLPQLFEAPTVERLAILIETMLEETRLSAIWADLLGREHVGLDDRFFDLGGNLELLAALQHRIATEFGCRIPIAQLSDHSTLRQQVGLTRGRVKDKTSLPPGVMALQPYGTRNRIFWVHYLSAFLARVIGDDQPFFHVALTEEDVASLGKTPTLQSIARCLVRKILATQPKGPYTIGGYCLGGILAFEIASQLQAAGLEVSLLVLLDPPSPSFLESRDSMAPRLSHPRYLLKRATRLGARITLVKLRGHLLKRFPGSAKAEFAGTETSIAQQMIETAASAYQPQKYEGKVLLLLASDRPPHVDFLPGWQAVVARDLHTQYVDAHHSELTRAQNVRSIADAIAAHLVSPTNEMSLSCCASTPVSAGSGSNGKVLQNVVFAEATEDGKATSTPLTP